MRLLTSVSDLKTCMFCICVNVNMQGRNLRGGIGVAHPKTIKICYFAGQKRQFNVFLKGNLLDPGPFDQVLLLKKRSQRKYSQGKPLTLPPKVY